MEWKSLLTIRRVAEISSQAPCKKIFISAAAENPRFFLSHAGIWNAQCNSKRIFFHEKSSRFEECIHNFLLNSIRICTHLSLSTRKIRTKERWKHVDNFPIEGLNNVAINNTSSIIHYCLIIIYVFLCCCSRVTQKRKAAEHSMVQNRL